MMLLTLFQPGYLWTVVRVDTDHVKVVISQSQIVNLPKKSGKYGKRIGEKSGKLSTKSSNHIAGTDTASSPCWEKKTKILKSCPIYSKLGISH